VWGISIPINIFTVLVAIASPFLLLMLVAQQPAIALMIGAPIIGLIAWRRSARHRQLQREADIIDQRERHLAELQADAIARRLKGQ
jgi:hypothetical protein